MTETALRHAKRPANPLAGPYGHPFHPLVVMLPIGTWIAAVLFDVISFAAEDGEAFVVGARWLYGIGIIGAVVAAILGFFDYSRLARGTKARRMATFHMALNLAAIVIFTIAWAVHLGDDEPTALGLVLGIVGIVGISISGFLGGELVYRYGARVADEKDQARGHEPGGR